MRKIHSSGYGHNNVCDQELNGVKFMNDLILDQKNPVRDLVLQYVTPVWRIEYTRLFFIGIFCKQSVIFVRGVQKKKRPCIPIHKFSTDWSLIWSDHHVFQPLLQK